MLKQGTVLVCHEGEHAGRRLRVMKDRGTDGVQVLAENVRLDEKGTPGDAIGWISEPWPWAGWSEEVSA